MATQDQWRFCAKCFGMFYFGDPNANRGRCSVGGAHQGFGFNFVLPHDVPEAPGTQQAWRFCFKCFGMFYDGDQQGNKGRCPAGAGHEAFGFNFVLPHSADFLQFPSISLHAVAVPGEGRFVEIHGVEFTAGGAAHVNYDLVFSDGGPTTHQTGGDDVLVGGGRSFVDRIQVSASNLTSASAEARDTVTGTEVTASL
ncbi:MAG: hypothetical protein QOH34_890 [Mycobacterium sp.]|nr:hypothetical protein [Mycobacterium sp.]